MHRVCKTFWIETGHFLTSERDTPICGAPHGHSRKIEIVASAKRLDESGMVCDFLFFKQAFGKLIDEYDHAMLINTDSPHYKYFRENFDRIVPFKGKDPTSEIIAETMFKHFEKILDEHKLKAASKKRGAFSISKYVKLERVRVWETATSWAEYSAE